MGILGEFIHTCNHTYPHPQKRICGKLYIFCVAVGYDGHEEGHRRSVRGESVEERRDHPGRRRRVHNDGEAHPRTVGQTPILNGPTLMLPEQGMYVLMHGFFFLCLIFLHK